MKAGTIILLSVLAGGILLMAKKKAPAQPGGINIIPNGVPPVPTFNFQTGVPVSVSPNAPTSEQVQETQQWNFVNNTNPNQINWGSGGANWGQFGTQWGNTPLF